MKVLFIFLSLFISGAGVAHGQASFLYEITLLEQYQHRSLWSEREQNIQAQHIAYLDSLSQAGQLEMAGIVDLGLEGQQGLIILKVRNYEEARQIVRSDPSIKEGMMSARIRPITIYFRRKN